MVRSSVWRSDPFDGATGVYPAGRVPTVPSSDRELLENFIVASSPATPPQGDGQTGEIQVPPTMVTRLA